MSVLVILGSKSDKKIGDKAVDILAQFGVDSKMIVASAHRSPEYLHDEIEKSDAKVIIAVAGLSAALPGAVASKTTRPVIGVPVSGKISLDSLL
ncbi:MAG: AIR carboxylase family protein, partial [Thermoplasmata archaeon]|nr:AIR carboxylase family protein [Thermoplasmata archaeon]